VVADAGGYQKPQGVAERLRESDGSLRSPLVDVRKHRVCCYNGGSLRDLYAVFLDEASDLLRRSELKNLATGYRELASEWSDLADTAAPRSRAAFATARSLIDAVHEQVFEEGDAGRNAAATAAAELWDLRTKMQVEEIFTPDEFAGLLRELSGRLEAVSAREQQLIDRLATVVKEVER
jgi:hypothetical protein